ncbi:hypothetical protein EAG18_05720 [Pseudoalteromonas sp. J010]|uniref:hypothetical protein n=1 Tax=Pseudoalteromonas sp. J010 TaxID=998465 RepID=UPI000F646D0E|nr:hypothetical protein [Pseudoalteromonas sp. J010]RRS09638.1 hypothetical protein EAG18_05720 [Pseudoalteromonas sp. J010]
MTSTTELKSVSETVTSGIAMLLLLSSVLHLFTSSFIEALVYLIIALVLFSYCHRLTFDPFKKQVVITKQLSVLSRNIWTIHQSLIPLKTVTDMSVEGNKQLSYLGISYLANGKRPAIYSFSCLRQTSQLDEILSGVGFDQNKGQTGASYTDGAARETPVTLAELFPSFMRNNRAIEACFPVLRCALPTPQEKRHIAWMVVGGFGFMTGAVLYSSQNYVAGLVLLVLTYLSYWLMCVLISNKHYFVYHSPCNEIEVEKDSLLLPALLFKDKQPRKVNKGEVKCIKAHWNTFTVSDLDRLAASTRRNHIVELVFDTEYGTTVSLSGMSVEAEPLLLALTHWQYPLSVAHTNKAVFPIVKHFQYGMLVFILGIIIWAMTTYVLPIILNK